MSLFSFLTFLPSRQARNTRVKASVGALGVEAMCCPASNSVLNTTRGQNAALYDGKGGIKRHLIKSSRPQLSLGCSEKMSRQLSRQVCTHEDKVSLSAAELTRLASNVAALCPTSRILLACVEKMKQFQTERNRSPPRFDFRPRDA
jgi:hypothetical protein